MSTIFLGNPLIEELLGDPVRFKQEGRAYQLLEEYFSGLSVETLRPLLRHENGLVRHAALWVMAELGDQACELLDDATPFIASDDRFHSYHALEIAAVCATGTQIDRFVKVAEGLESDDTVIRSLTMRLMSRADQLQLQASAVAVQDGSAYSDVHKRGLKLLAIGDKADPKDVQVLLGSDHGLDQIYGAIAAKRLREKYPELLKRAAALPNLSIREFVSKQE